MENWRLLLVLCCAVLAGGCRPREEQVRTIPVRVFADAGVRKSKNWQSLIRSRFKRVSRLYENAVQVRWKVAAVSAWSPANPENDPDGLRLELKKHAKREPGELVVGIIGMPAGQRLGSSVAFSDAIVVINDPGAGETKNSIVLAHELAHLFWVSHTPDKASLLHEAPSALRFDAASAAAIRRMRNVPLGAALEHPDPNTEAQLLERLAEGADDFSSNRQAAARIRWALLLRSEDLPEAALRHLREATVLAPLNPLARYLLALTLKETGRSDEAIAELQASLSLNPSHAEGYTKLGVWLAERNRLPAATDAFRRAAELRPGDARTHLNLGAVLLRQPGLISAAQASFREALRIQPDFGEAQKSLADAIQLQERLEAEFRDLRRQTADRPQDMDAWQRVGINRMALGHYREACEAFRRVIQLRPGEGVAHLNLAVALYASGRRRQAKAEADRAQAAGAQPHPDFLRALAEQR